MLGIHAFTGSQIARRTSRSIEVVTRLSVVSHRLIVSAAASTL